MLPKIKDIKLRRKKIGISQIELAKRAGVSQSLIAKIESSKIDPSYTSVSNIFSVLDVLENSDCLCAKDVMSKKVITIDYEKNVQEAIKIMRKLGLSQIPITSKGLIIGSLSEKAILDKMIELEDTNLLEFLVKDIMDDSFPTIGLNMPISAILAILKYNQAIIITKKDKILGIITKANLLNIS